MEQALLGVRGPDEVAEFADQDSFVRFYRLRLVGTDVPLENLRFPSPVHYALLNGTLHNYLEVALDCATDHQALAAAFNGRGDACWDCFEGGFAACLKHKTGLWLAADALGEKSLCWAQEGAVLWFSTSPLLLAYHLRRLPRTGCAVYAHLALRGQPVGETYFTGIRQLPPGHILHADTQGIHIRPWLRSEQRWQALGDSCASVQGMSSALAMKMRDGVAGIALSGGLDSSLLTVVGSRHAGVHVACSLTPGEDAELRLDQQYANRLAGGMEGLIHLYASPNLAFDTQAPRDFPVLDQDEFGLNSVAATLRAGGCNLLISGDGADELFCGYDRIYRFAAGMDAEGIAHREGLQRFLQRYAYADLERLDTLGEVQTRDWRLRLWEYLNAATSGQHSHFHRAWRWFMHHHLFWLLRKLDFVGGCHGMESRTPFLHHGIVASAASLQPDQLLPGSEFDPAQSGYHRQVKKALKNRMGQLVPEDILARPKLPFPIRASAVDELYYAALPDDFPPVLPHALHDGLLDGACGQQAKLLYLSYLVWNMSCRNLLT